MLRRSFLILTAILLYLNAGSAFSSSLNQHEEECYAVAMVAYDTVINSSLGLPLDEIIDSMVKNNSNEETSVIYQDFLMLVVMDAYNWQGTPHTYAVKALYQCASSHSDVAHVY